MNFIATPRKLVVSHLQSRLRPAFTCFKIKRLFSRPASGACDLTTSPRVDLARLSADARTIPALHRDFQLFPVFLNSKEQHVLLSCALKKLDEVMGVPRDARKRRRQWAQDNEHAHTAGNDINSLFPPEDTCTFEEGHYDGVIRHFRETQITQWPASSPPLLTAVLARAHSTLLPHVLPDQIQTHLLHLAAAGEILPHVDNIQASGGIIVGISLGAERVVRFSRVDDENKGEWFDVLLPSGSAYVQRDTVRYKYEHSVSKGGVFRGREVKGGQRLSIMMRDRLSTTPS
ncbi:hypothetical protein BOTBODRAFT_157001 [Botryobasidium botryosum FD-172 SS1]|uniref:Alpha-ketoglutarate-dependent dioxygenase AlkB-like domain-containing protein n=1 Tax=Botryobasidium botryosum (strain FD-172 SS1) TaxID=930990 RepID=A0A067MKA4_BOTB1|nr:hypothetical protein BOTBODRAFT_157001 [Botryobasidium botryosum FD-172 SS1]